jgi:Phage integrase family
MGFLHFHDLRHTYASLLVMAGVSIPTLMKLLGHKSTAMTMRYANLSQAHKAKAVEVLDRIFSGIVTSKRIIHRIRAFEPGLSRRIGLETDFTATYTITTTSP